ncbi:aminotransferase family protein [Conexibacter woesei]|uniref:Aminotransferase class-III n=1 Tax=Conexibacter woesei (strain DSM 14684 / CCUG 47730 / CIP 108061 / JCM 11494 / NBRC 100937 / ID131577) TaxID=469383 RepID=D3EZH1_CONWI|nr:aspartate aminotransferase family protein [Conexibacter woesei]ADB53809.1 aminotransferase class-III [Conexibacter woesei DSM 14684]
MTSSDRSGAAVADTRLWHPFSDMSAVRRGEFVLTRGEGIWVYDDQGRRYLDGTASLWYANVGHGRKEIAAAVQEQMGKLEAYSAFGDFTTEPAQALAARIAGLAPVADARVFFTTGGGEALDSAAKIARRYWSAKGHPERVHLIGRTGGYHGTNGYGTSIGGIEANRAGFGPLMSQVSSVQWDSLTALEQEILAVGPQKVAAVFAEPVIGAGGVLPPPEGYLEGVQAICEEHGILFVADEVICAFGRLGHWFGSERFGLAPDMITFAKGVTSGYLPLGGVVASGRVAEPFWDEAGNMLRHGATYSAHATCCVAGSANLDLLAQDDVVSRALELESVLLDALKPLAEQSIVHEVRGGVGLLAAVEFTPEALAAGAPGKVFERARERGVIVRALGQGVAVSPPLTIERDEIAFLATAIGEAIEEVGQTSVNAPATKV